MIEKCATDKLRDRKISARLENVRARAMKKLHRTDRVRLLPSESEVELFEQLSDYARILPTRSEIYRSVSRNWIHSKSRMSVDGKSRLDREITHAENYDLDRTARFPDEEVH